MAANNIDTISSYDFRTFIPTHLPHYNMLTFDNIKDDRFFNIYTTFHKRKQYKIKVTYKNGEFDDVIIWEPAKYDAALL